MTQAPVVVFLGRLGHGKTRLVNLICGTSFSSIMSAASCTSKLQTGRTLTYNIEVVDTPGFASSHNTAEHTLCQIEALETRKLSGIYIVVKYGRVGEMAEAAGVMMDFADTEKARIIVTFADAVGSESERIVADAKARLAELLEISVDCILVVGLHSDKDLIEHFIHATLIDPPEFYHVSSDFRAYVNTLQVGARKSMVYLNALCDNAANHEEAKLQETCDELIEVAQTFSPEERHFLVSKLQHAMDCSQGSARERLQSVLVQTRNPINAKRKSMPEPSSVGESASKKGRTQEATKLTVKNTVHEHRSSVPSETRGSGVNITSTGEGFQPFLDEKLHKDRLRRDRVPRVVLGGTSNSVSSIPVEQNLRWRPEPSQHNKGQKKTRRNRQTKEDCSEMEWCRDLDNMERGEVLRTRFRDLSLESDPNTSNRRTENTRRRTYRKAPLVIALCMLCIVTIGVVRWIWST